MVQEHNTTIKTNTHTPHSHSLTHTHTHTITHTHTHKHTQTHTHREVLFSLRQRLVGVSDPGHSLSRMLTERK